MGNDFRLAYYYLDLALRRPLAWTLPALLVLAAGFAYVANMPRSYFSEAVIIVGSQAISSDLVQSTVANERLQFIEQRVLARDNLLRLMDKFELLPDVRTELSKTELAQKVRSQITITMRASEPSDQFASSSVFGIGVEALEPDLAADMASEIAALIIEENRRARMSRATEATAFLAREVETLTARMIELDKSLADYVRSNDNALPTRLPLHLGDIREAQSESAEIEQALAEARANADVLRAELSVGATQVDVALQDQQQRLRDLKADLVARSSVLTPQHHLIRSLKSQIDALEIEIARPDARATPVEARLTPDAALVAQRLELTEQQVRALETRERHVAQQLAALRQTLATMPSVEAELTALQREREAVQRNLEDMSARLNTARVGERLESDQQGEQIQILEEPEPPLYASGNSKTEYMLAVMGASIAFGFGCLYLSDLFDSRIRGAFDVDPLIGEAPLLSIGYWRTPAQRRRTAAATTVAILGVVVGASMLLNHYEWRPDKLVTDVIDIFRGSAEASAAYRVEGVTWKA